MFVRIFILIYPYTMNTNYRQNYLSKMGIQNHVSCQGLELGVQRQGLNTSDDTKSLLRHVKLEKRGTVVYQLFIYFFQFSIVNRRKRNVVCLPSKFI